MQVKFERVLSVENSITLVISPEVIRSWDYCIHDSPFPAVQGVVTVGFQSFFVFASGLIVRPAPVRIASFREELDSLFHSHLRIDNFERYPLKFLTGTSLYGEIGIVKGEFPPDTEFFYPGWSKGKVSAFPPDSPQYQKVAINAFRDKPGSLKGFTIIGDGDISSP